MGRNRVNSDEMVLDSDEESVQELASNASDPQATAAKQADDSPAFKLSFVLELFSHSEMQKAARDRASKSSRFSMTSEEPFDTFKAQILAKISDLLKPATLSFEDYSVTYIIKKVQKKTSLENEDDYGFLLSLHPNSDINVTVIQKKLKPAAKVSIHLVLFHRHNLSLTLTHNLVSRL